MAEASWPDTTHNSRAVTDVEYEQLVGSAFAEGFVGSPYDTPPAYGDGSGLIVKVRANRYANVRGHVWSSGTADLSYTITSNSSGSTRYDLLVLRLDRSTWTVRGVVKAGAGTSASQLTRQTGTTGYFEIPVAVITVRSGASVINSGDVKSVAYFVQPPGVVTTNATYGWVPTAPGRVLYETDTTAGFTYGTNRGWDQTLTRGSGMRYVAGQSANNGTYLATYVTSEKQFSSFQAYCEPGHLYQLSLDVNVRRADSGSDDTMYSAYMYVDGIWVYDSGSQSVPGLNNFRHQHLDTPFVVGTAGPHTFTASIRRVLGSGSWHVMCGGNTGMWFRVYDLGTGG